MTKSTSIIRVNKSSTAKRTKISPKTRDGPNNPKGNKIKFVRGAATTGQLSRSFVFSCYVVHVDMDVRTFHYDSDNSKP